MSSDDERPVAEHKGASPRQRQPKPHQGGTVIQRKSQEPTSSHKGEMKIQTPPKQTPYPGFGG